MATKLLLILTVLSGVAMAAPFSNYRDFFLATYDAFEGTSDSLYYTCLPSTKQWELYEAYNGMVNFLTFQTTFQNGVSSTIAFFQLLTDVFGDCRLFVIPYSLQMTLDGDWDIFRSRLFLNFISAIKDLSDFYKNFGYDWTATGTAFGSLFRQFTVPSFK